MDRLTFMTDDYYAVTSDNCFEDQNEYHCGSAIDKLAEYEDAEAEGRLIVLPCKVGDTVWFINRKFDWLTGKWTDYVNDGYVKAIKFSARPTKITVEYPDPYSKNGAFKGADYNVRNIGKTLFLTHEEAERALGCK